MMLITYEINAEISVVTSVCYPDGYPHMLKRLKTKSKLTFTVIHFPTSSVEEIIFLTEFKLLIVLFKNRDFPVLQIRSGLSRPDRHNTKTMFSFYLQGIASPLKCRGMKIITLVIFFFLREFTRLSGNGINYWVSYDLKHVK